MLWASKTKIDMDSGAIPPKPINERGAENESPDSTSSGSSLGFCSMSIGHKLTIVNFCTTNLFVGAFYSVLGPFFPIEAAKKGVSSFYIGLIYGVFQLVIVLTSPVIGTYLTRLGAKRTYVCGISVCGAAAFVFGFLNKCPDGPIFIAMCLVVRIVEALGAAALTTASVAILANTFPDNVATALGTLESFVGIGLMAGAPLGGVLFQLGGYWCPFVFLGSGMLIISIITVFALPSQTVIRMSSSCSVLSLLRMPIVIITGLGLMSGAGAIGYLEVTLAQQLELTDGLSPIAVGFVFVAATAMYALTTPIWGVLVDKKPKFNKLFASCGFTVSGIGFYLIGPAPFLHLPHMLWLVVASVAAVGIGCGSVIIVYKIVVDATVSAGFPQGLDMYSCIAGTISAFFSLGAFVGPVGGGYLHDLIGFEMSSVVIGSCTLGSAFLLLLYIVIVDRGCRSESGTTSIAVNEQSSLLRSDHGNQTDQRYEHSSVHERQPSAAEFV